MNGSALRSVSVARRGLRALPLPVLAFLLLLLSGPAARAQETYHFSVDQVIVSEDSERVTAVVSVLDPDRHPPPPPPPPPGRATPPAEPAFTSDRDALLAGIDRLAPEQGTGTALYDSVLEGLA